MSTDELLNRLQRIYSALDETIETDLSKFRPTVVIGGDHLLAIRQDFLGDLNSAQIENLAHSVIHNIANFPDHLRRWAKRNKRVAGEIDAVIASSLPFQLIQDLSNNDKHGYPPRDGGRSGKAPQLKEINRIMSLKTGSGGGSVGVSLSVDGPVVQTSGDGSATVVVTGTIVDQSGATIGDLYETEVDAIDACERMLRTID